MRERGWRRRGSARCGSRFAAPPSCGGSTSAPRATSSRAKVRLSIVPVVTGPGGLKPKFGIRTQVMAWSAAQPCAAPFGSAPWSTRETPSFPVGVGSGERHRVHAVRKPIVVGVGSGLDERPRGVDVPGPDGEQERREPVRSRSLEPGAQRVLRDHGARPDVGPGVDQRLHRSPRDPRQPPTSGRSAPPPARRSRRHRGRGARVPRPCAPVLRRRSGARSRCPPSLRSGPRRPRAAYRDHRGAAVDGGQRERGHVEGVGGRRVGPGREQQLRQVDPVEAGPPSGAPSRGPVAGRPTPIRRRPAPRARRPRPPCRTASTSGASRPAPAALAPAATLAEAVASVNASGRPAESASTFRQARPPGGVSARAAAARHRSRSGPDQRSVEVRSRNVTGIRTSASQESAPQNVPVQESRTRADSPSRPALADPILSRDGGPASGDTLRSLASVSARPSCAYAWSTDSRRGSGSPPPGGWARRRRWPRPAPWRAASAVDAVGERRRGWPWPVRRAGSLGRRWEFADE